MSHSSATLARTVLAPCAALSLVCMPVWSASLFVPGSSYQVQAGNSPDTFTATLALTPGTTVVDNGALSVTFSDVLAGGTEWLVFRYATTGGGPIAQGGQNWSIAPAGLQAATAVDFVQAYAEFGHGSASLTPTSSIFSGYSVRANPVPGATGTGLGTGLFSAPFAAGPLVPLSTFISPFSFLGSTGIDPAQVNTFTQAYAFTAQVPEPASALMLLAGAVLLGSRLRRPR